MKKCAKCNTLKSISEFWKHKYTKDKIHYWCKSCAKRSAPDQAKAVRKHKLKKLYKISLEDFEMMYASQLGKCLICENYVSKDKICIDHDHESGKTRGLLCRKCNIGLGMFNDEESLLNNAASYILRARNS